MEKSQEDKVNPKLTDIGRVHFLPASNSDPLLEGAVNELMVEISDLVLRMKRPIDN